MERFNADYVAYENFFNYNTYVIRFRKRNEEFRKRKKIPCSLYTWPLATKLTWANEGTGRNKGSN